MKTIGVLGGSFDPPHIGHGIIAETVITSGEVDEVWIMPTKQNPLKSDTIASDNDRMTMVNLMAEELTGGIFSSNFELTHGTENVSYTYNTLRSLHSQYPDHVFKWIVGMDCVDWGPGGNIVLSGWKNSVDIVKEFGIILVTRGGYYDLYNGGTINNSWKKNPEEIIFIEADVTIDLSSTYLRSKLMRGEYRGLKTLLTEPVLDYIRENNLYLKP